MREDQIAALNTLSEKLADVVIDEADPDGWPGSGMPMSTLSREDRGDRYWCKKNAAASMSLLMKVESIIADQYGEGGRMEPRNEEEIDKEYAKAEREAEKLLDKVAKAASRKDFVAKSVGKA